MLNVIMLSGGWHSVNNQLDFMSMAKTCIHGYKCCPISNMYDENNQNVL